jgi:hypothetical protein
VRGGVNGGAEALAPLVRPLPHDRADRDGRWIAADLARGLTLLVGVARLGRAELIAAAGAATSAPTSRSEAAGRRALAVAPGGRIGVDIETPARVALNARIKDDWLAAPERSIVARAGDPVVELACHWVLKEAFGKALGVGLAMPLARLAFAARHGRIALRGPAAPASADHWSFGLYRHDDLIVGVAFGQAIPFAPCGRNPPTSPPDR